MKRAAKATYWRKTCRLTVVLLLIWLVLTFCVNWFASTLNEYTFLDFPLGFYMAAQGELLIFLLLIGYYNRRMNALEREFDIRDE